MALDSKKKITRKKKTQKTKRIIMALFGKMDIPKYMNAKFLGQASGASDMWAIDAKYEQRFRKLAAKAGLIVGIVQMGVVR